MWDHKKSLILSKLCAAAAGVAVVALLATGPMQLRWLHLYGYDPYGYAEHSGLFLATLYSGGALMLLLLWQLYLLLHNLGRGVVFAAKNAQLLRRISWCCFGGAAIGVASGFYYVPWAIVGGGAAFVGLIVRVVKNVIAEAIALKEENDLTV